MTDAIYAFFHDLGLVALLAMVISGSAVIFGCFGLAIMHGNWHGGEVRLKARYRVHRQKWLCGMLLEKV